MCWLLCVSRHRAVRWPNETPTHGRYACTNKRNSHRRYANGKPMVAAASQAVITFRKRAGGGPRPRSFSAFQALKLVEAQGFPILLTTMQGERSRYRGTARVRSIGKRKSPAFLNRGIPEFRVVLYFYGSAEEATANSSVANRVGNTRSPRSRYFSLAA